MIAMIRNYFSLKRKSGRIEYFDLIRGAAMLLVIAQHCGCWGSNYILAFHMPLFFYITGLLYNSIRMNTDVNFTFFLKKKINRLIFPYFLFEIINLVISLLLKPITNNTLNIGRAIKSIMLCLNDSQYDGIVLRLWFFPCIFWAEIMLFLTIKFFEKRRIALLSV